MNGRMAIVAVLTGLLILPSAVFAGIWTSNGPYGGSIQQIWVNPVHPNKMLAVVQDGGCFQTKNWGTSWTAIGALPRTIGALAGDDRARRIYVSSGLNFYRSLDQAETWELLASLPSTATCLALHPGSDKILYLGTLQGLKKSSDGGSSWQDVGSSLPKEQIESVVVDPFNNNIVYASVNNEGVFKSSNSGSYWTAIYDSSAWFPQVACHPRIRNRLYMCTWSPPYFAVSTNGGTSWEAAPSGSFFDDLVADPFMDNVLYTNSLRGLFKSIDFGETWEKILSVEGHAVAVDPSESGILYAGTLAGVLRSSDGGATWFPATAGINEVDKCIAVDPGNPGTVYVGDEANNIFRSTDGGVTWTMLPFDHGSNAVASLLVYPNDPDVLLATTNGYLYRSADGGWTWDDVLSGYIYATAVEPVPPYKIYACSGWPYWSYAFTGIHTSTDGGKTWQYLGLEGINITNLAIDPANPKQLFAGGDDGLYRSENGGSAWSPLNLGVSEPKVDCLVIDPRNPQILYAGVRNQGVYRSSNSGNSWLQRNTGLNDLRVESLAVDPETSTTIYAGTYSDGLYISGNSGQSWSLASPILNDMQIWALQFDAGPPKRLYAGTNYGLRVNTITDDPAVMVDHRSNQVGSVNKNSPSQLLPATYLTLGLLPDTFPNASFNEPVLIEMMLPQGTRLSQTLADGVFSTKGENPLLNQKTPPLALSEYMFNPASQRYEPLDDTAAPAEIDERAVELFRYVAGENAIWLRVNVSTTEFQPGSPDRFLGVTIGLGGGVWPPNEASNWGSDGVHRQANTQFFADVRNYDFATAGYRLTVSLRALYQQTGQLVGTEFQPSEITLFNLDPGLENDKYVSSPVGPSIKDFDTADLNQDGYEDMVSVDGENEWITWVLGQPDGSFGTVEQLNVPGIIPVTVDLMDFTGPGSKPDGRPELVFSSLSGTIYYMYWPSVWSKGSAAGEMIPVQVTKLAVAPSATMVQDVNHDTHADIIYTDASGEQLVVLFGSTFSSSAVYACGHGPAAITAGDFDGDSRLDLAVANRDSASVSVYRNNGSGFDAAEYAAGGSEPVDIKAADFNRDGRADLVVALADDRAISIMPAGAGGSFDKAAIQKIYFLNAPSAVLAENFDGQHGADVLVGFRDFYKLALCVSQADGRLAYAYTLNTLGDVELDYVNHATLNEDNILAVGGGTGAGGVSSVTGVAALGEMPINLIHFPRSRQLSFSVVNMGTSAALLNLELYEDAGTLTEAVTTSIGPGLQFARYLTDPALLGSAADDPERWVRAFLTEEDTYGLWLGNDGSTLDYLDGFRLPAAGDASSSFVLPEVWNEPGEYTEIILLNPSQKQAAVNISLMRDGTVRAVSARVIAGRGRIRLDLETVFPSAAQEDYVQVISDRPVIGLELFGDSGRLAGLEGMDTTRGGDLLYGPHVAIGDLGLAFRSDLTLVNAGDQAATLSLDLVDDAGDLVGFINDLTLNAGSKLTTDLADLFALSMPVSGYLVVDPHGAEGIVGAITFQGVGDDRYVSSLPLLRSAADHFLVGHLATGLQGGTNYFTGVAVLNPDAEAKQVRVSAYDQNGILLDSQSSTIPGNRRDIYLLHDRLTGLTGNFGGYLLVDNESTTVGSLLVFVLFGDEAYNFLSAVPAVPRQ
ncbi:MAG: VCBS repeat-containing protein [Acidobacteria bacterium]|nr:VCBS repeat-containing protein [Acidobacteriota bacterium]